MSEEFWVPVVGNEGTHEVSSLGRVRSIDHVDSAGRRIKGKLIGSYGDVYPRAWMPGRGNVRIHVLVLESFVGPCPEGFQACHANDIKNDNRLSNLRWGTPRDNRHDSIRNGTFSPPPVKKARRVGCLVSGCAGEHKSNGYCGLHNARFRRHGDPLGGGSYRKAVVV